MTIRMKDVAADLGLSVVTVSKVLHNHPDIREETRERVLRRIKEMNYQPNIMARSLVTGRSYLVGLVVPDLLHPFFAEVAKALSMVVKASGYSVIIASTEEDPELERREIRHLQSRRLDALVVASIGENIAQFEQMNENGEVLVMIDRDFPELSTNYVGTNDKSAGRIATDHLLETGCRRIAHIRGRQNSTGAGRLQGYKAALSARGIAYREDYVIACDKVDTHSIEEGAVAMRTLLQLNPIPDGVFCYNDPLAIGAIDAILGAGLKIPEDIAVIGCGNLHYNSFLRVPLSSIDQHSQQIGERAGELVLSLLGSKNRPRSSSYILEPALVVRASSRRAEPAPIKAKIFRPAAKKRAAKTK